MRNELKAHNITKSQERKVDETGVEEFHGVIVYSPEICYLCKNLMRSCRNDLITTTSYTETQLCEILEKITSIELTMQQRRDSAVCQECFMTLERYDELIHQSREIQHNLTVLFHRTNCEQVPIQEDEKDFKLQCQKCNKTFTTVKEMTTHKHIKSQAARAGIDESSISKEFVLKAQQEGITYDYEVFQRAFFNDSEKESVSKLRGERSTPKTKSAPEEEVSKEFQALMDQHGIEYNIEKFQKAFGFSELEAAMTKGESPEKLSVSDRQTVFKVPKKAEVNPDFLKILRENGNIEYNLAVFQRSFGYSDVSIDDACMDSNEETTQKGETRNLQCTQCDESFTTRRSLQIHTRNTHQVRDESLYCKTCTKSLKTPGCLQVHLATDHGRGTGPFECPVCMKSYPDKPALRSHFFIHTQERAFLCGRCGATFLHKKSFEMHMLVHDDIRPFACTIPGCSKKFRNAGKLKIHLRVHTGEKIYECPHCPGKRFAQKWGMDLHIKKQHKDEVTQIEVCNVCSIQIQTKAKLRKHLKNVHQVVEDMELMGESD